MLRFENFIKKNYDIFIVDELNGFKPLSLVELLLLDFFSCNTHSIEITPIETDRSRRK